MSLSFNENHRHSPHMHLRILRCCISAFLAIAGFLYTWCNVNGVQWPLHVAGTLSSTGSNLKGTTDLLGKGTVHTGMKATGGITTVITSATFDVGRLKKIS